MIAVRRSLTTHFRALVRSSSRGSHWKSQRQSRIWLLKQKKLCGTIKTLRTGLLSWMIHYHLSLIWTHLRYHFSIKVLVCRQLVFLKTPWGRAITRLYLHKAQPSLDKAAPSFNRGSRIRSMFPKNLRLWIWQISHLKFKNFVTCLWFHRLVH